MNVELEGVVSRADGIVEAGALLGLGPISVPIKYPIMGDWEFSPVLNTEGIGIWNSTLS